MANRNLSRVAASLLKKRNILSSTCSLYDVPGIARRMSIKGSAPYYEYIVVGVGGIGSGALYWLSRTANSSVLGIEQFKLGHDYGGSQDHSRIIRHMYFDEMYTKLTKHTYEAWAEVERESGITLMHLHGSLDVARRGTSGIDMLQKYEDAMKQQHIPYECLTASQLMTRFPQWRVDRSTEALFQKDGGLVDAALANSTHVQLAQARGADVIEDCSVISLKPRGDECIVNTSKGTFRCRRVIVTAGAWINQVLRSVDVHVPVTVTQEQVTYMATPNVKLFTKPEFPVFIYHTPNGFDMYGMPSHANSYFKIGIDSGGNSVTPSTRSFVPDPVREKYCEEWTKRFIPQASGEIKYTKTCLYTMTQDRNFVVDSLSSRGMPQIVVCCGAGHAFKFASFLGKILAEIAVNGSTAYDISGFQFEREAVQKDNFPKNFWRGDMTKARL